MAYALLVERIEQRTIADRAAALVLSAHGEIDPPDIDDAHARFDELLIAEPETVDPEKAELLVALGLRKA